MKKRSIFVFLMALFYLGVTAKVFEIKLHAKEVEKEVLRLSEKVLPDFSFANSTDDEIKVMTILHSAKAKKRVDMAEVHPDEHFYNEFDLKEYEKASKKLFGKVIPHGLLEKLEGGYQTYYDKATNTIFQEVFYNPGDSLIKRNKRTVKKLKKDSFKVEYLDSLYYPLSLDKLPTKKMQVYIRKKGKNFVISDIKLFDFKGSSLKLTGEDVKKQILAIKKWFVKQPKNVVKKSFKREGNSYITLTEKNNLIFIYEKEKQTERRYYYKDGIPVRIMETKNGKLLYSHDLSYDKKGSFLVDGKKTIEGDPEWIMSYFLEADYVYNKVDAWR